MIKALIVDDEKLARKGLMSMMPWQRFGMEIVGEAPNGKAALEFINANPVDLLVTDLTMPFMSGMELIKEVKERFPAVWVVVLTCHQEFSLIQEALRLGAIDYIVKTQLDSENVDDILQRIAARIAHSRRDDGIEGADTAIGRKQAGSPFDTGMLLVTLDKRADLSALSDWSGVDKLGKPVVPVDSYAWLCPDYLADLLEAWKADPPVNWALTVVRNPDRLETSQVINPIRMYLLREFFYGYHHQRPLLEWTVRLYGGEQDKLDREEMETLHTAWTSLAWVSRPDEFNKRLAMIRDRKPDIAQLKNLLYSCLPEINKLVHAADLHSDLERLDSFVAWEQWENWLAELRQKMKREIRSFSYSEEVIESIYKAMKYIDRHYAEALNQNELARLFNISRSYFSICFKDIVGKSFSDYVRDIRIEKAQSLLIRTNKPIFEISQETGLKDDRYFSKMFRETVGMSPTEYRNRLRSEGTC